MALQAISQEEKREVASGIVDWIRMEFSLLPDIGEHVAKNGFYSPLWLDRQVYCSLASMGYNATLEKFKFKNPELGIEQNQ